MTSTFELLCEFVRNGDLRRLQTLLADHHIDLNEACPSGELPLRTALDRRNEHLVKLLLRAGASVDAPDGDQSTTLMTLINRVLHEAAISGNMEQLAWLLDAGLDVNHVDHDGFTLLMVAIPLSVPLTQFLLSRGADPNHYAKSGTTPLMLTVCTDNLVFTSGNVKELVVSLLRHGADLSTRLPTGEGVKEVLDAQDWIESGTKAELQELLRTASAGNGGAGRISL